MALMVCALAGCGSSKEAEKEPAPEIRITATAKQLLADDTAALMTVDLTGGYSVEFATGAAYFYKGDASGGSTLAGFGFVITEQEYTDEVAYLLENPNAEDGELKDLGNGAYSYGGQYYFPAEDDVCIKVVVEEAAMDEADSIWPRFTARRDD